MANPTIPAASAEGLVTAGTAAGTDAAVPTAESLSRKVEGATVATRGVARLPAHAGDAPADKSRPGPSLLVRGVWPYVYAQPEEYASQLDAEKVVFDAWALVTHPRVMNERPAKLWESFSQAVQHVALAACEITVPVESDAPESSTASDAEALRCGWGCSVGNGWVLCSAHLLTTQRDADAASFEFLGATINPDSSFHRLLLRFSASADGKLCSSDVDCALVYVSELELLPIEDVRSLAPTVFSSADFNNELRLQLMITRNAQVCAPSASERVPTLALSSDVATSDEPAKSIELDQSAWVVVVGDLGFASVEAAGTVSTTHSLPTVPGQSGTFVAGLPQIGASPLFLGMIQGAIKDGEFSAVTPHAVSQLLEKCRSVAAMFRSNDFQLVLDVIQAVKEVQADWARSTSAAGGAPAYAIIPFNERSWMMSTTIKPRRVSKVWLEKFRVFAYVLKCCTMEGHWIEELKAMLRKRGKSMVFADGYAEEVRAYQIRKYENESKSRHHGDLIVSLPQPRGTQYWEMRPFEDKGETNLTRFVMLATKGKDGRWEPDARYRFASVDHYHDPKKKALRKRTPSQGWFWVR